MTARTLTITSGKGGVGKTTATANLAVAMASMGQKVTCIDSDIGLRNLDVVLGLENRIVYDLVDAIEGRCRLRQAMIRDKRFEELYLIPAAQTRDKNAVSPTDMIKLVIDSGVIYDLTDWTEKYQPDLFNKQWGVVFPASHHAQLYNGRVAGLLNDGDQITLLCRSDYLDDPEKKKAFADKYGYELSVPHTWKEYFNLAQFMHDPAKGFYGSLEYRSPYYVKWMFMQRLVSKGKLYFDADMNPTFNSEEGVAALEDMLAMNPYLHPDAFSFTWSSNYNAFGRGEGFMNIVWPSGFKYSMAPSTGPATTGKIAATVMPADFLKDGSKLYAGLFCWGYGYAVSKYSANPELAYAYSQWMTSPTISADAIPYLGGYSDPYRVNHMLEPTERLIQTYTKPYLKTLYENMVNTVPDFCLPGGFEYQDALDKQVHACMTGDKKPKEALEAAAHSFDRITKRIGKDKVRKSWLALAKNLAEPIKKASGADKWPDA